jgi:hypothetical protein
VEARSRCLGQAVPPGAYASVGSPDVGLLERQVCDVLTEVPRAIDTLDHARRERGTVELG